MVDSLCSAAMRSPFSGHPAGSFPNTAGGQGVHLNARLLSGTVLVSTWISGLDGLTATLHRAWGQVPAQTGQSCNTPHGLALRTGPEELLLLPPSGQDMVQALRAVVPADVGAVTDLGHARCCIRIEGPQARATLNKLFPLDLREAHFPTSEVRLTGTHHVPCALYRVGTDCFDMLVFSTYAYDQLATVMDAALEFGVVVTLQ